MRTGRPKLDNEPLLQELRRSPTNLVSASRLADVLEVDRQTIERMLDDLENEGLISQGRRAGRRGKVIEVVGPERGLCPEPEEPERGLWPEGEEMPMIPGLSLDWWEPRKVEFTLRDLTCTVCGETFQAKKFARYCSMSCNQKHYYQRNRIQRQATCSVCEEPLPGVVAARRKCAECKKMDRRLYEKSRTKKTLQSKCLQCGKKFRYSGHPLGSGHGPRKYCSNSCRYEAVRSDRICERAGCGKKHSGRGLCADHYNQVYRKEKRRLSAERRLSVMAAGSLTHDEWQEILTLVSGCFYCDGPYEHRDHVVPLSRGGTHDIGNVVPSCQACNLSKGAKLISEWAKNAESVHVRLTELHTKLGLIWNG